MVKLVVASDLHLGITAPEALATLAAQMAAEEPDLTVLAGDLGEPLAYFRDCLDIFKGLPGTVAVLAGNHDVWATDGNHSQELWERWLPEATRAAGMLWLEEELWQQDGVAVVGSMAWYDYSAGPRYAPYPPEYYARVKSTYSNDARFLDWPWSDSEMAARLGDTLYARLMGAEANPAVDAIAVVTHVPLFEEQMVRRPRDLAWEMGAAYFGNLTLGWRVLDASKVRWVVSGHTHIGREGLVGREGHPEPPPVRVSVVPSEYDLPAYVTLDVSANGPSAAV